LRRHWFEQSALADLLGKDFGLAESTGFPNAKTSCSNTKKPLFDHLTERWRTLFAAKYEVLLYDLTSTYFGVARDRQSKNW
jgi:hypothetical protein